MEDRIQINGIWYVREQSQQPVLNIINDITHTKNMMFDGNKYCFEAVKLKKTNCDEYYDGCYIEFTDRREQPQKKEHWDNTAFFTGVLNNDPEPLQDLRESVCPQGEAEFKAFLKILQKEGWL